MTSPSGQLGVPVGVRWLLIVVVLAVFVGYAWLRHSPRTQANARTLCMELYRAAHSAADSAEVDRHQVIAANRRDSGIACRSYREYR
jgi:hypothetical protein